MIRRRLAAADVPGLSWLDEGTRVGLATAVAAGADRALVLGAFGREGAGAVGVVAVDLPPWRGRTEPWLWLVDVDPGSRGTGIGTALLLDAHRRLAALGNATVELSVDDSNVRAAALYRRLGYGVAGAGTDPGPAGGEPWTRMRLELPGRDQSRRNR